MEIYSCSICAGSMRMDDKKLSDPKMTLQKNPLARPYDATEPIKRYNMERLREDAHMRSCPVRGAAYSSIMDTRFKGE